MIVLANGAGFASRLAPA